MDNNIKDHTNNAETKMSNNHDAFVEYFVKKAEKISGAIYILTNFIPANEPIRVKIQKNVLKLLSNAFLVKRGSQTGDNLSNHVFALTSQTIPEIISLMTIAHASGYITEMNSSIIITELKNISASIMERYGTNKMLLVSKDDLFVPLAIESPRDEIKDKTNLYHQGHNNEPDKRQNNRSPKTDGKRTIAKRNERRDTIMRLVGEKAGISVKDVSVELSHYSEKTLQRELMKMVEEGILRRDGERRWSRYFGK